MPQKEQEHILVCLSSSPSNAKIIEIASQMAVAFNGKFTALYVKNAKADKLSKDDTKRLQLNMRYAEELGATVTTVYGEDVSYQIAEFARLSRISKIVIGRSSVKRSVLGGASLPERLTAIVPNLDVYIIPDAASNSKYAKRHVDIRKHFVPTWKDMLIILAMLLVATGLGLVVWLLGLADANIITIYVMGVLLTAFYVQSYMSSVIGSLMSVLLYNFFFSEPQFSFVVDDLSIYLTFVLMLVASLIVGMLASKFQRSAQQSAQSAYRTQVLFDTNQMLQKERSVTNALQIVARQLNRLLDRDVIAYPVKDGKLQEGRVFSASRQSDNSTVDNSLESANDKEKKEFSNFEQVEQWLNGYYENGGEITSLADRKRIYFAVGIAGNIYGVVGVYVGKKALDPLENSILQAIIGECALAIDNMHNAEEKEKAAVLMKHEQMRSNMLRAISHDLRTPLTSIAGNADHLLNSYSKMDTPTRKQVFSDIYDEAIWLVTLVENLLSVTRIEDGRMNIKLSCELVEDIMEEALTRVIRRSKNHEITASMEGGLLLAKCDARLIIQVLINLVDNAIKYTPPGSHIVMSARQTEHGVEFSVADDGNGISDDMKERVFEMFYTGDNPVVDSRRSLGLGLSLCKSIVGAHGGQITLRDNVPHGAIFSFTVPLGEVTINE